MKKNSNWNSAEKEYAELRREALGLLKPEDVASAPYVYVQRQQVTKTLTRIDLFRQILEVQGAVVECGVHNGSSLFLYDHLSAILEPYNLHRKIIGFDTFEGFKSLSPNDSGDIDPLSFSDTDFEHLQKWKTLQQMNRAVSHVEKIELIKGDACNTIPAFVEKNPHLVIAMLYLDFDIYEPTKVALQYLLPLVPKGGVVVFDELNQRKWPGETIAFKEEVGVGNVRLRKMAYDPWPSYYVVE